MQVYLQDYKSSLLAALSFWHGIQEVKLDDGLARVSLSSVQKGAYEIVNTEQNSKENGRFCTNFVRKFAN